MGGATDPVGGSLAAEESDVLLVFALAGLALFSILSILLGTEDGREPTAPRTELATWVRIGLR